MADTRTVLLAAPLAAAALIAACAPAPGAIARPEPELPRPTPEDVSPAELPTANAVAFAFGPGSNRYTIRTVSEVSVRGDSIPPAVDTVTVQGTVLLAVSMGDSVRSVAGSVYGSSLQTGALIRQPGPVPRVEPPASVDFEGEARPGATSLSLSVASAADTTMSPDSTAQGCSAIAAMETMLLGLARETLPPMPRTLAAGATWRDSVSVVTCRTQVSIITTTWHQYQVVDIGHEDGVETALIRRISSSQVAGSGEQSRLPVRILGEGSGQSELRLDVTNGRLLSSEGRSRVIMKHSAGDRTLDVEQVTTLQVQLAGGA